MMATNFLDPGGGNSLPPPTYANSVKAVRFQPLNRNILEVILEKKIIQKNISINGDDVSRICAIIGMNIDSETEGYQPHYGRKSITLSVCAKNGVSQERFVSEQDQRSQKLTPGNQKVTRSEASKLRPAHRNSKVIM